MNTTYLKARHGAERFLRGAPQFLELKQLAELEDQFRRHCLTTIRVYQGWKRGQAAEQDVVERHYRLLEGALLRRQAQDATRLYGIIRKDMRRSFRKYIAACLDTKF